MWSIMRTTQACKRKMFLWLAFAVSISFNWISIIFCQADGVSSGLQSWRMSGLYGPVDGGTNITFDGNNLSLISAFSVFIGDIRCQLTFRNDTKVTVTSPAGYLGITTASVHYSIYGSTYQYPFNFTYLPSPEIVSVAPNSTIISGGVTITVRGRYLTSVSNPLLNVVVIEDNTQTILTSPCQVVDADAMTCQTPDLNEYGYYASDDVNDGLVNNGSMQFFLGFTLDGLKTYSDLRSSPIQNYSVLNVFLDPTIYPGEGFAQIFTPNINMSLTIKGQHLNRGCSISDYTVMLESGRCKVVYLDSETLRYQPPNVIPDYEDPFEYDFIVSQPRVWVNLGQVERFICHIKYLSPGSVAAIEYEQPVNVIIPICIVGGCILIGIILIPILVINLRPFKPIWRRRIPPQKIASKSMYEEPCEIAEITVAFNEETCSHL